MRHPLMALLLAPLLLTPAEVAGQSRWSAVVAVHATGFVGGSRAQEGLDETIRPAGGSAVGVGLARTLGRWRAEVIADYLGTNLQLVSPDLAVTVRSVDFSRARIGARVSRRIVGLGSAELRGGGGVFLEGWISGDETRSVAGAEGSLSLRITAGGLAFENGVAVGVSPSPLRSGDLPDGYELRGLRSLALTTRVLFRL